MRAPLPLHYNNSSLRKSAAAVCLLTLRPLAELLHSPYFPDPQLPHVSVSPCENINKQGFYYSHSWKFPPPSVPWSLPVPSVRRAGPGGHRAALWSVRPESQDVEVRCLPAVSTNRTWEKWTVQASMPGFTASVGQRITDPPTPAPLRQTCDMNSGSALHSSMSVTTVKGKLEKRIKDLFGDCVSSVCGAESVEEAAFGPLLQSRVAVSLLLPCNWRRNLSLILGEAQVLTFDVAFATSKLGGVHRVCFLCKY